MRSAANGIAVLQALATGPHPLTTANMRSSQSPSTRVLPKDIVDDTLRIETAEEGFVVSCFVEASTTITEPVALEHHHAVDLT